MKYPHYNTIPGRSCTIVTHDMVMTVGGLDRAVQGVIDSDIAESDIKRIDIWLDHRNEFVGTVTLHNRRKLELPGRCFGR